jgi:hypothetical protein
MKTPAPLLLLLVGLACLGQSSAKKPMTRAQAKRINSCISMIQTLEAIAQREGNAGTCLGCDPTLDACPVGCQNHINDYFTACNGIELPDGAYFDKDEKFSGTVPSRASPIADDSRKPPNRLPNTLSGQSLVPSSTRCCVPC